MLAGLTGRLTDASGMREVRQEQSWQRVNAVLLRSAPEPKYAYGTMTTFWVPGRWRTASGRTTFADVPAVAGAKAGSVVPIWIDRAGRATGRIPLTRSVVIMRAAVIVVVTLGVLAIGLLIVSGVTRWLLDRRRLMIWGIEWACFGPRWTSRR